MKLSFPKYIILLVFSCLSILNLKAQLLEKIDEITGLYKNINDFNVNSSGDRFYLIYQGADSILINGFRFNIEPRDSSRKSPYYYGRSYFAGISNGNSPFLLRPGGQKFLSTDSSLIIFTSIIEDSLKLSDTTIINYSVGAGSNLFLREYDFYGKPLFTKLWKSAYDCSAFVNSLKNIYSTTIMVGEYAGNKDGLLLDSQFISIGSGNLSCFIGKMNNDRTVQWLRSIGGDGYEINNIIAVNKHFHILNTGASASSFITFCNDSLDNRAIFDFGTEFLYFVQIDTNGNCINKKTIDYNYGSTIPTGIVSIGDGSYIVSGVFNPSYIGFDAFYLYNPNNDFTGFLVKLDDDLSTLETFQLEGSKGTKWIQYLVSDSNDNVWLSGYSSSDTLIIGSFHLIKKQSESTFSFLAKLDKNFNALWANRVEGEMSGLKVGDDGNIYLLNSPHFGKNLLYKINDLTKIIEYKQKPNDIEIQLFPNPLANSARVYYKILNSDNTTFTIYLFSQFGQKYFSKQIDQNSGYIDIVPRVEKFILIEFVSSNGKKVITKRLVH